MKVAVIGTGRVGSALGGRLQSAGHHITYGSRDPERANERGDLPAGTSATGIADAALGADAVLLAIPLAAARETLAALEPLDGLVLVDATNRFGRGGDDVPEGLSAAQAIASWAPGARVVKAFNTTGSGNMTEPHYGGDALVMPFCGDDAAAKRTVETLVRDVGFEPLDCGALDAAHLLESFAALWVHLAYRQGHGPDIGFRLVRR